MLLLFRRREPSKIEWHLPDTCHCSVIKASESDHLQVSHLSLQLSPGGVTAARVVIGPVSRCRGLTKGGSLVQGRGHGLVGVTCRVWGVQQLGGQVSPL